MPSHIEEDIISYAEELVEAGPDLVEPDRTIREPRPTPSRRSRVGETLAGRYQLQSQIGEGGMGVVYLAKQLQLNRTVVVKLVSARAVSLDEKVTKRFALEASTLARLTHPNVVTVFDHGQTNDGELFIAMEYLAGRTLDRVVKEDGPLGFDDIVDIAIQIARALREAHANHVIHRDLKPKNVIALDGKHDDDGYRIKVLDFGLAKLLETDTGPYQPGITDISRTASLIGSPRYMSPEQVIRDKLDQRTDVYSLGLILFELAAGTFPFKASTAAEVMHKHLTAQVPRIAEVGYGRPCPDGLEPIIRCCLEKLRDKRYATMNELLSDLKSVAGNVSVTPSQSSPSVTVLPKFRLPKVGTEVDPSPSGSYPALASIYDSSPKGAAFGRAPLARMDSNTEPNPVESGKFDTLENARPPSPPPPPYIEPAHKPAHAEMHFVEHAPEARVESVVIANTPPKSNKGRFIAVAAVCATVLGAGALLPTLLRSDPPPVPVVEPAQETKNAPSEAEAAPPPTRAKESAEVRVVFESVPAGARVREGGVLLGITPFIRDYPRSQDLTQRNFVFELEGYESSNAVAILAGERMTLKAELHAAPKPVLAQRAPAPAHRGRPAARAEHARTTPVPAERAVPQISDKPVRTVQDRHEEVRSVDDGDKPTVRLVD